MISFDDSIADRLGILLAGMMIHQAEYDPDIRQRVNRLVRNAVGEKESVDSTLASTEEKEETGLARSDENNEKMTDNSISALTTQILVESGNEDGQSLR